MPSFRSAAWGVAAAVLVSAPRAGVAQDPVDYIRLGDSALAALDPALAHRLYLGAHRADSSTGEVHWKLARAIVDRGKQLDDSLVAVRDSLFDAALGHARRAAELDPADPNGHYMIAEILGRLSLTRKGRERIEFGREIYQRARHALRLDPEFGGAWHVLGAWHAEVERLSAITRFLGTRLFGARLLERASWDSAQVFLERAVELQPGFIYHRLELAEIHFDRDRPDLALRQLQVLATLPVSDVEDDRHLARAAQLRRRLESNR